MRNRIKEEERIERVVRSLAKLPENRRCINCNSLGPQYVCSTFWTFVCTNCSGIQREFNHRVKSVSMAKFTAEEVSALQAGGNERAKEIYFKEWDPHRHSYPDTNNIPRLRDFIRSVYVERKFTGERSQNSLPRIKLNDNEESHESRKICFSRSPHYEERNDPRSPGLRNEDKSVKFYYDDRRSPRYSPRNGNQRRNHIKIEIVDDRFRDDEYRNRRRVSIEKLPAPAASSNGQKSNVDREKVEPASAEGSVKEKPDEQKNNDPETQSELSIVTTSQVSDAASAVPEAQAITQSEGSDWAPFENSSVEGAPQTSITNTSKSPITETTSKIIDPLEFLLAELSGHWYAAASAGSEVPSADNGPSTTTVENVSAGEDFPPSSSSQITASPSDIDASSVISTTDSQLTQPSIDSSPLTHQMIPPVETVPSNNQPTVAPEMQDLSSAFAEQPTVAPEMQDLSSAFADLSLQATLEPSQDTQTDVGPQPTSTVEPQPTSTVEPQPSTVETKSIGRKELPADLFTLNYLSGPASRGGWQNFQPHDMGYGLQYYPSTVPVSAFPTRHTNPFDIADGGTQVHSSPFSTMATLQDVGPTMSNGSGLLRASSFGTFGSAMLQSPNYASPMPQQSPFTSGFPTGPYFEQINNNMQHPRPRRAGSFDCDRIIQQSAGGYMAPNGALNSFPKTGGNPFG